MSGYLTAIFEFFKNLFYDFFDFLWSLGQSIANWVFDKLCGLVEFIFGLIDFVPDTFVAAMDWAGLPTQLIYVLNQIGFGSCLVMLFSAILIRVTLNLIPSVLTRV